MQATASKLEGSRVRLDVEVGPEDLQREYARAIRRVSGRVSIPGFRRGKAPRIKSDWAVAVWRTGPPQTSVLIRSAARHFFGARASAEGSRASKCDGAGRLRYL